MSGDANDVQSAFLDALVAEEKVVWVFLLSGIKLNGQLVSSDQYVLLLQSPSGIQTVFKSAVSTVCPSHVLPSREAPKDHPSEHRARFGPNRFHR